MRELTTLYIRFENHTYKNVRESTTYIGSKNLLTQIDILFSHSLYLFLELIKFFDSASADRYIQTSFYSQYQFIRFKMDIQYFSNWIYYNAKEHLHRYYMIFFIVNHKCQLGKTFLYIFGNKLSIPNLAALRFLFIS